MAGDARIAWHWRDSGNPRTRGSTGLASRQGCGDNQRTNCGTEEIMKYLAAAVFYPMLWMRGLVLALGRLMSGFAVIAAIVIALISLFTRYRPRWSPQKRPYVVTSKAAIEIGRRRDCFTPPQCGFA